MIWTLEVVTCALLAGVSDGRNWCRERNNLQKGDVILSRARVFRARRANRRGKGATKGADGFVRKVTHVLISKGRRKETERARILSCFTGPQQIIAPRVCRVRAAKMGFGSRKYQTELI